jgi:CheY-like chemotaxis protein
VRMREDFLAVVAHDLRSPLAVVAMSAELLERQEIPDQKREISRIRRSTKRMSRLIADLLDVSSMQAGHLALERAPEDVGALIVTALEITSPLAAEKHISLSSHVDRGSMHAWCDRERVIQVLLNLLGNAIKFTAAGVVSVRAQRCGADEVVLSVHDTGKGMSRPQIEHAFDAYWQAAPQARQGTGLGLSIVKGIVELHGGRVWAESNQGRGSSFSFTLPTRAPGAADSFADITMPHDVPDVAGLMSSSSIPTNTVDMNTPVEPSTGPLVLLIDDEGSVRESIAEALRSEGYDVVALPHGRAALDYLESAPVLPSVILLDLVMPVMDGWEFLRQQSRAPRFADVPVVLVSAQADRAGAQQLQRLAGYIQKPVRLASLCEVVGNCTSASA